MKSASILLVEDNPMDVELILDAFKEARLTNIIHVAENGKEALEYVFGQGEYGDRKQYPLPDIILLDLKMPEIDGHEVLRQIKGSDKLKRLPVIILTSSSDEGDRAMSYEELDEAVNRFAAALQAMGVGPGDRVAIILPNCPQFVIAFYGTLRAGGSAAPLNFLYAAPELEHQLNDSGARVAVVLSQFYEKVHGIRAGTPLQHIIATNNI